MAKIKVRARTVDMLGRQQIAGIPTAISELFKNAHDAYADKVEVDFYRHDQLFVLRDNGNGMTNEEFLERWLTLGTESKLAEKGGIALPSKGKNQRRRAILGEKGIGRLAVASIGNNLLVLTRPKYPPTNSKDKITVGLLSWPIFALPGLDISEIEVPTVCLPKTRLPSSDDVKKLIEEAIENLSSISSKISDKLTNPILRSLENFDVDPNTAESFLPSKDLSLLEGGGTHFFTKPADPMLADDLDSQDEKTASPLVKMLIGFTNTILPDYEPPIVAKFRDYKSDGVCSHVIDESEFFTTDEFESSDHHFKGTFDKFGQFSGSVQIYGKKKKYVCNWPDSTGVPTKCGPFGFDVAYVQGTKRESMLPPENWGRLVAKLDKIGGLYIYRDDVRVLPYGDSDYDFLNIEKRRTKSAGYYFFSFRRMFGGVRLSRKDNSELQEKAGREGFRQNKAYRQFKNILENFFIQLAADFFREEGKHGEIYEQQREELNRNEELRKKRESKARQRRKAFKEELESFFDEVGNETPEEQSAKIISNAKFEIKRISKTPGQKLLPVVVLRIEQEAKQ